jgi:vacuolar-type H+-ATPase subunit H
MTRAEIAAYIKQHVQTPRCDEYHTVLRQLTGDERDQVVDMTEEELTAYLKAVNYDMAQRTLESYAASIEAFRKLTWAERDAAQKIIAARRKRKEKTLCHS